MDINSIKNDPTSYKQPSVPLPEQNLQEEDGEAVLTTVTLGREEAKTYIIDKIKRIDAALPLGDLKDLALAPIYFFGFTLMLFWTKIPLKNKEGKACTRFNLDLTLKNEKKRVQRDAYVDVELGTSDLALSSRLKSLGMQGYKRIVESLFDDIWTAAKFTLRSTLHEEGKFTYGDGVMKHEVHFIPVGVKEEKRRAPQEQYWGSLDQRRWQCGMGVGKARGLEDSSWNSRSFS